MRKDNVVGSITGSESIIGSGVRIKGNLTSEHDIIIDGTLTGNVKTKGAITVGINASIKGNLVASDVTIAGQVEGDVKVSGHAGITETGQVKGNIASATLSIGSGGIFMGNSIMTISQPAHEPAPEPSEPEPSVNEPEAS